MASKKSSYGAYSEGINPRETCSRAYSAARVCYRSASAFCAYECGGYLTFPLFALASVIAERSYNRLSVSRDHTTDEGTGYIPARCEIPMVPDAFSILLSDAMSCCERLSLTGL